MHKTFVLRNAISLSYLYIYIYVALIHQFTYFVFGLGKLAHTIIYNITINNTFYFHSIRSFS